jgi:hypothetical protein
MAARPEELALFHMADEPGWYYPAILQQVRSQPKSLAVFRDYLRSKGLTPADVGKASWEEVFPSGLSTAKTLPEKRLFFWTTRFYAESLSNSFAAANAALLRQLNPRLHVTTNLNNWPGRYFIPSPGKKIANNRDTGPDAAMGEPDWFDLGRKKAVSCLWTEDWFGDADAQLWSLYADLMRCAAREGGVEYGGYVVGHPTGAMPDGGKYKLLALAGHGARSFDFYIFGPNPAFADGWSEKEATYRSYGEAVRLLGRAERLLYPGRPRDGSVAILFPQASQAWDTDSAAKCYLSELYGLHAALTHEHYGVDFVDDFGIEAGALAKRGYAVLYVTAPNLSAKAQQAILDWVKAGGTLVLLPGACAADEYNEPADILTASAGVKRTVVPRVAVPHYKNYRPTTSMPIAAHASVLGTREGDAIVQTAPLTPTDGKSLATFAAGGAAVVEAAAGRGRVVSFGYWPGVTYWLSPDRKDAKQLPQGWSRSARQLATAPARMANAAKVVDVSAEGVEAVLLESEQGVAVTLLNWTGQPLLEVTVTVGRPGKVAKVASVEQGALKYHATGDGLAVTLPLKTVDVLLLER